MAKNYFDRYVWLIETIVRHGYISFEEINRLWQKSPMNDIRDTLKPRTFFNHIEAIADTFGIEIKYMRPKGYYIENSSEMGDGGIRQWLLESLSLNNLLNEAKDMKDRILIEKIPSSRRWLPVIVDAMRDDKAVEMTYQSFTRSEPHTFVAHPWCLKLFRQRWYVLARCEDYNHPRIYSLDRIHEIHPVDKKLEIPRRFSGEEFFADYFGVIVNETDKVQTVDVRVDAGQAKYFESLPLHASQAKISEDENYVVFRYHVAPSFDFKQELLSRGSAVEVLAPEDFRAEMKAEIAKMASRYA